MNLKEEHEKTGGLCRGFLFRRAVRGCPKADSPSACLSPMLCIPPLHAQSAYNSPGATLPDFAQGFAARSLRTAPPCWGWGNGVCHARRAGEEEAWGSHRLRILPEEKMSIAAQAGKAGLAVSEYIRRRPLDRPVKSRVSGLRKHLAAKYQRRKRRHRRGAWRDQGCDPEARPGRGGGHRAMSELPARLEAIVQRAVAQFGRRNRAAICCTNPPGWESCSARPREVSP